MLTLNMASILTLIVQVLFCSTYLIEGAKLLQCGITRPALKQLASLTVNPIIERQAVLALCREIQASVGAL